MAQLICSGVNRPDLVSLLTQERVAGMVSAHCVSQPALWQALVQAPQVSFMLDSGAFQRSMPWHTYLSILERVGHRFTWISSLDVMSDPAQSARNDAALRAALPPELREKLLWIDQGGGLDALAQQASQRGFIGLGGFVPRLRTQGIEGTLAYLSRVGQVISACGAQAHLFGIGSARLLQACGQMPWVRSIDTSRWLLGYRAHTVLLLSGEQRRASDLGLLLTPRECAANNMRTLRRWVQGDLVQPSLWLPIEDVPAPLLRTLAL